MAQHIVVQHPAQINNHGMTSSRGSSREQFHILMWRILKLNYNPYMDRQQVMLLTLFLIIVRVKRSNLKIQLSQ
jgi:hypothetical protein